MLTVDVIEPSLESVSGICSGMIQSRLLSRRGLLRLVIVGWIGFLWGAIGSIGLLVYSTLRLSLVAQEFFDFPATLMHWIILIVWLGLMAYMEGYKGFQRAFSPRVAARLIWLKHNPCLWLVILAPIYAIGLVYSSRRRFLTTLALLVMVIGFVTIAVNLPQPWRPIIDAGVVVGLSWGIVATLDQLASDLNNKLESGIPQ